MPLSWQDGFAVWRDRRYSQPSGKGYHTPNLGGF